MDARITAAVAMCTLAYYNYVHIYHTKKTKKKRRKRRRWMNAVHHNRTSHMKEQFLELTQEPSREFENLHQMSLDDFNYLLSKVEPFICKQDTHLREAIPAKIRLSITLRFLVSGDSYRSMHNLFKISSQLISKIVVEVCKALNEALKDEIKMPENEQQWLEIENGFKDNFPHALGAIGGKHILIHCPVNSGSECFNYKKTFSLVLLALVDSNYNILYADIGSQGMICHGGVLKNSRFWGKMASNSLHLPKPCSFPGTENIDIPYVFLADRAFALHNNIMKPYPGNYEINSSKQIFNMRLLKSQVVVDNAFGILSSKFKIFRKPIDLNIHNIPVITMTCLSLHNFLKKRNKSYIPPGTVDVYDNNGVLLQPGSWRRDVDENCALRDITHISHRSPLSAVQIRNHFTNYFKRLCTQCN